MNCESFHVSINFLSLLDSEWKSFEFCNQNEALRTKLFLLNKQILFCIKSSLLHDKRLNENEKQAKIFSRCIFVLFSLKNHISSSLFVKSLPATVFSIFSFVENENCRSEETSPMTWKPKQQEIIVQHCCRQRQAGEEKTKNETPKAKRNAK